MTSARKRMSKLTQSWWPPAAASMMAVYPAWLGLGLGLGLELGLGLGLGSGLGLGLGLEV